MLPYQSLWIQDRSRLKLMQKSRQVGISWATAYELVSSTGVRGNANDDWISSRDDLQARLLIHDCQQFAGMLNMGCEDLGEVLVDETGRHSAYVLRYSNGCKTHSLSSNPDAQAGKRGRRVLDEFALHPDPQKLYSIAYPGTTWGGSMEIISTHRGSANFFNDLVNEVRHKGNPKGISLHTVTLYDALEQGFLYKLQRKLHESDTRQQMDEGEYAAFVRAGCADEESWQQEFLCNPADDASAFLPYDLIAGCEYQEGNEWKRSLADLYDCDGELYLGVDIGRFHDLTVMWLMEGVGDVLHTRQIIELKDAPFAEQETRFNELMSLPRMRRACIDDTGIGRQFTERGQARWSEHRVEGITFSNPRKEELAYPLKAALEAKRIRIPNDKWIRSDLRSVRKEYSAGNPRFVAESGKNGHADRFWALALSINAAGKSTGPGIIRSVTTRQTGYSMSGLGGRRGVGIV